MNGVAVMNVEEILTTAQPEERAERSDGTGERALMCAVLADAIKCLAEWQRRPGPAAEARCWVMSSDREWPFSFENLCDALGFRIDEVRRRLIKDAPSLDTLRAAARGATPRAEHPLPLTRPARATRNTAIVCRRAEGLGLAAIGRAFGLSTSQVANICKAAARGDERPREPVMSPRERTIVQLVTRGLSTDDIAHRLEISPATVKVHLTHVFRDLGINDRSALADYARQAGLDDVGVPAAVDQSPATPYDAHPWAGAETTLASVSLASAAAAPRRGAGGADHPRPGVS